MGYNDSPERERRQDTLPRSWHVLMAKQLHWLLDFSDQETEKKVSFYLHYMTNRSEDVIEHSVRHDSLFFLKRYKREN